MFVLSAKIEVNSSKAWVFDKVTSVEITRDTDTLTDTCILQLPRKIKWQGETKMPFKRGDKVKVSIGYDGNLELAFIGYITTIGLKTPITIKCEDGMFLLKNKATKKLTYKTASIEQILKDQDLNGLPFKVFGEQAIGQYRVTAETVSGLLNDLKDVGIKSFVKIDKAGSPTLYCGVLFEPETDKKQVFISNGKGVNIIDDKNLKIQSAADTLIKIKAISIAPDNKKTRVEVGDADGERRTLHTYNKTEAELTQWANQELKRLKRDGLTGSFTTFGGSLVDKLDNIAIKIDGVKQGIYQVQKNVIKYDAGGFRQEITIGNRIK